MNPVTITVIRPAGRDPVTGEKLPGATTHTIDDCAVAPRTGGPGTSSRNVESRGREGVIEGLTIYGPFDADVSHTDRVLLPSPWAEPGDVWEVDGEVGRWSNPITGHEPGCEFAIKRTAG